MRFCQPVYETWLDEAVASGRIVAPGFLSGDPAIRAAYCGAEWIGPSRGHIQPLQEVNALREHVELGTKTLQRATAETDGGRWDRNHRQRAKEKAARVAADDDSRRKWLVMRFCQPVYETWLDEAVASGRIVAPGFLSGDPAIRAAYCGAEWIGPSRGHIQPLQEVNALREHVELGTKTLQRATAETDGGRWDRNHRQRAKEKAARVAAGLEEPLVVRPLVNQEPPDKIDKNGNDD